ncbi:MAG: hypothetical protein LBU58_04595, partial [Clostridiales bacterium]|nr:hypothetical protein [Clostridiales bacterium]
IEAGIKAGTDAETKAVSGAETKTEAEAEAEKAESEDGDGGKTEAAAAAAVTAVSTGAEASPAAAEPADQGAPSVAADQGAPPAAAAGGETGEIVGSDAWGAGNPASTMSPASAEFPELTAYLDGLSAYRKGGVVGAKGGAGAGGEAGTGTGTEGEAEAGAIVMSCEPFTFGHRYLVEYAASRVPHLYFFLSEDENPDMSFADRFRLAREGVADLANVTVVPGGRYAVSRKTFAAAAPATAAAPAAANIETFASRVAPALNINICFLGGEKPDGLTREYNATMLEILPQYGIAFQMIPRKAAQDAAAIGLRIQELIKAQQFDEIEKLVPEVTLAFLRERFEIPKVGYTMTMTVDEIGLALSAISDFGGNVFRRFTRQGIHRLHIYGGGMIAARLSVTAKALDGFSIVSFVGSGREQIKSWPFAVQIPFQSVDEEKTEDRETPILVAESISPEVRHYLKYHFSKVYYLDNVCTHEYFAACCVEPVLAITRAAGAELLLADQAVVGNNPSVFEMWLRTVQDKISSDKRASDARIVRNAYAPLGVDDEYAKGCLTAFERTNESGQVRYESDCASQYVNRSGGMRQTKGLWPDAEHGIYFVGYTVALGIGADDGGTIESALQALVKGQFGSDAQYNVYNYANSPAEDIFVIPPRLRALPLKPGDVVICLLPFPSTVMEEYRQQAKVCNVQPHFERPHELGEIFVDTDHMNANGYLRYAEVIFDALKRDGLLKPPEGTGEPKKPGESEKPEAAPGESEKPKAAPEAPETPPKDVSPSEAQSSEAPQAAVVEQSAEEQPENRGIGLSIEVVVSSGDGDDEGGPQSAGSDGPLVNERGLVYTADLQEPSRASAATATLQEPSRALAVSADLQESPTVATATVVIPDEEDRHMRERESDAVTDPELLAYLFGLTQYRRRGITHAGAVVINGSPFTFGHRYLVEAAAALMQHVYVFVVEEEKSAFPYDDRLRLAREGIEHVRNATVVPGGRFVISQKTIESYFTAAEKRSAVIDATAELEIFARYIAPALNIVVCYAGEKPLNDNISRQYDSAMHTILPRYDVAYKLIPRREYGGVPISASRVRALLRDQRFAELERLVPPPTLAYLREMYDAPSWSDKKKMTFEEQGLPLIVNIPGSGNDDDGENEDEGWNGRGGAENGGGRAELIPFPWRRAPAAREERRRSKLLLARVFFSPTPPVIPLPTSDQSAVSDQTDDVDADAARRGETGPAHAPGSAPAFGTAHARESSDPARHRKKGPFGGLFRK